MSKANSAKAANERKISDNLDLRKVRKVLYIISCVFVVSNVFSCLPWPNFANALRLQAKTVKDLRLEEIFTKVIRNR